MTDLDQAVWHLLGSSSEMINMPLQEDDPRQRRSDIALACVAMEWEPSVALKRGLNSTIAYSDCLRTERVKTC